MASLSSTKLNGHVPAWKKLGLKLQVAAQTPQSTNSAQEPNGQNGKRRNSDSAVIADDRQTKSVLKKRKNEDEISKASPQPERKKKSKRARGENDQVCSTITDDLPNERAQNGILQKPSTLLHGRRKSVTFGPDVKTEDGDSIKTIYDQWLASQGAMWDAFDELQLPPALRRADVPVVTVATEDQPAVPDPATIPAIKTPGKKIKRKDKQGKGSKSPAATKSDSNDQAVEPMYKPPFLQYLISHHSEPTEWKFSKALQNHLLKHVFSIDQVPLKYDHMLKAYLSGLQGSNARNRLRGEALGLCKANETWLLSPSPSKLPTKPASEPEPAKDAAQTDTNPTPETPSSPQPLEPAAYTTFRTLYTSELAQHKTSLLQQAGHISRKPETLSPSADKTEELVQSYYILHSIDESDHDATRAALTNELNRRKRCETIISSLGEQDDTPKRSQQSKKEQVDGSKANTDKAKPKRKRRKRKIRTANESDDSSAIGDSDDD